MTNTSDCIIRDLLNRPFCRRTYIEKELIVKNGRARPDIPALQMKHKGSTSKNDFTRHFHKEQYEKVTWLTGSSSLGKLFCWPCLLFSSDKASTVWNKKGYDNLNAFHNAVHKHERSQTHLNAFVKLNTFGFTRIELQLNKQQRMHVSRHNQMVNTNREIIRRLIDTVCHLAKQELPFRGRDTSEDSLNKGNYEELLYFLANYDTVLKLHLENATVFRGTSNRIQTDLIEAVSQEVLNEIKQEVNDAPFVAILLHEMSDVMNLSQLSTVLRYVTKDGMARERFVGFTDMNNDKTAGALLEHVVQIVDEFSIGDKLIAQSYDGAAVMAGQLTGLCMRVQERFAKALFIHCYAHELNLVLQQVCTNIQECRLFFTTLSGLGAFFSSSPKRSAGLREFMLRRLPTVATTRWIFTSRLLSTVNTFFKELMAFFVDVIANSVQWSGETVIMAQGFLTFLNKFDNCFLISVFSNLFDLTDVLYNILQTKEFDISYCYKKVLETKTLVDTEREKFDEVWEQAETKRQECNIEEVSIRTCENVSYKDVCRRVYCEIIDNISHHLEDRFTSMERFQFVQLLNPEMFPEYKHQFPNVIFKQLDDTYGDMFDLIRLKNELIFLFSSEEFQSKHPHALVPFMQSHQLDKGLPELYRLACLYLTVPSSTASVERSFSALQRIQSFVGATQSPARMSSLAFLTIEKRAPLSLKKETSNFYDHVIAEFMRQERRMEFEYK